MKDKRGFTLIELIVVLGLAGIVMSVVMSFFIANYKSYETINTESEVQYQSQYIINYITNKILETKEYKVSAFTKDDNTTDNKLSFEYADTKTASFEVDSEKIKYIYDTESPAFIGNYVKELSIEPISTKEVKINLILYKGKNEVYTKEQVIFMRNSN
jgi:prepilin-type N-terminal cleavage/methylation domain-containing protein